MLLADGTCTGAVPSSLAGWDPVASRKDRTKSSCTWRKSGGGAEASWGKSWSQVRGTELKGFGKNERLDGTWSRSKTGTVGTASTWAGTTLVLRSNGRFELNRGSHYTSNTNPHRGEVVVSGVGSSENAGTYTLDGFSLELKFDSGKVDHMLFAADSTRETARLGGQIVFKKK
jgi:redox-sensitive bicupin YhaK (pirin superfamily)